MTNSPFSAVLLILEKKSLLSVESSESLDTHQAWKQLREELAKIGIIPSILAEKRDFIINLIQRAVKDGNLEKSIYLTSILSSPQTSQCHQFWHRASPSNRQEALTLR